MKKQRPHYTVSSKIDKATGEKFWYCHGTETPNIPVSGSIGNKAHALAVAKMYNRSIGYSE